MEFSASAPCKAILFGEHYVVYGSPALAVAIEPRNRVLFSQQKNGGGVRFKSKYGEGRILQDGKYSGVQELEIYSHVASEAISGTPLPSCTAEFSAAWRIKGVGTSASLCAAFAAGLFRLAGRQPSAEEVFAAAQAGDLAAHGGRASGIDAKTVSFGCPLLFQKRFAPPSFDSNPVKFAFPKDTSLFLVDTDVGKRDGTTAMVEKFAASFAISEKPQDLPEEKRQEVRGEYAPFWEKAATSMLGKKATGEAFGSLMSENHSLLKKRGMSSVGIERAVSSALSLGAYGAKLTGAGGEGGAVLVACKSEEAHGTAKSIKEETGFSCHSVTIAAEGAKVD
jgi:mevalonate kinase